MSTTALATDSEFRALTATMRRRLGMSQMRLSRKTGISSTQLSRWESGVVDLERAELQRIAIAIDEQMTRLAEQGKLDADRSTSTIEQGKELAHRRRLARLSQIRLAQKTNISRSRLQLAEAGYLQLGEKETAAIEAVLEEQERLHPPITMTLAALLKAPEIKEITDAELNADRLYSGLKLVRAGFAFLNASKEVELADDLLDLRKSQLSEARWRFPWKA